jgi:flagellar L-ring protein precursor FlgH
MKKLIVFVAALITLVSGSVSAAPLYKDDSPLTSMFADPPRPKNEGDLVYIKVEEDMSTAKIDDEQNGRKLAANVGGGGILQFLGKVFGTQGVNLGLGRDDKKRTSRSDRVTSIIVATVTEVLPNGYLMVEGVRDIKVNQDKLNVVASGIVRPRDINREGEVSSNRMAEFQMVVKRETPRGLIDSIVKILF